MAYAALSTIQTIATGQVFTAATLQQANDNDEALVDPPSCSIKETTAQSISNATATALTSDEENYDNDSMHSTTSNTSRITIQTAGRYDIAAIVSFASNATGYRAIQFKVNNTTFYDIVQVAAVSGAATILSGERTLVLAAADYVECFVYQTSGGALDATMVEFRAKRITR